MNIEDVVLSIKSGYKLIVIESEEEYRVCDEIYDACKEWADIYTWTPTSRLRKVIKKKAFALDELDDKTGIPIKPITVGDEPLRSSTEVLQYIVTRRDEKFNLWILRNLDISQDSGFMSARILKDYINELGKNIIIIITDNSSVASILSRDYLLLRYSLMNTNENLGWLSSELSKWGKAAESSPTNQVWVNGKEVALKGAYKLKYSKDELGDIAGAFTGLTKQEVCMAFNTSMKKHGRLDSHTIASTKMTVVEKSGLVEWIEPEDMSNVGGLECIKEWMAKRAPVINNPDAAKYGLPYPKGLVLLGLPGAGKSIICKASASLLGLPLVRIDIGKVMQSYVGSSESNMRKVIGIIDSCSPVVAWIDEIDKSMSGVQSSTFSDSGTLSRVFGTFLTWAQERKGMVFIMATCNAMISNGQLLLPPELTRAGRFDSIYYVDQPTTREAAEIFRIHIKKPRMDNPGRDPGRYDIDRLSRIRYTDTKENKQYSYTGAEIEASVIEAMYNAYTEGRDYTTDDISAALSVTIPITFTMKDALSALRNFGKNRFRPASYPEDETKIISSSTGKEVAVKTKQKVEV